MSNEPDDLIELGRKAAARARAGYSELTDGNDIDLLDAMANQLEAYKAEIGALLHESERLKNALEDWQNCWLCPETNFNQAAPRLLEITDAALQARILIKQDASK